MLVLMFDLHQPMIGPDVWGLLHSTGTIGTNFPSRLDCPHSMCIFVAISVLGLRYGPFCDLPSRDISRLPTEYCLLKRKTKRKTMAETSLQAWCWHLG